MSTEINTIVNADCIQVMSTLPDDFANLTLTDIPYGAVHRPTNGLRILDKGTADMVTFDLNTFLEEVYRITKSTLIIFCGQGQLSEIFNFFSEKQDNGKGTVRQLIWNKTNPSPMNGEHIYLSGIENAIWFKKRGGTFNARCKNTVFSHASGRSKLHPTEKNHKLLNELILDNSNTGDLVFDPCSGSGSHLLCAKLLGRTYFGVELDKGYYDTASARLQD